MASIDLKAVAARRIAANSCRECLIASSVAAAAIVNGVRAGNALGLSFCDLRKL